MEQRNGRIDRHGQRSPEVWCRHFAFAGWEDQRFLDVVVEKVRTQRADLGSVGDVIAAQVEEALRGERKEISTPEERRRIVHDDVRAAVITRERIRELQDRLSEARRTWRIYPETLQSVLEEALRLVGHPGLEPLASGDLAGRAWILRALPAAWAECRPLIQDAKGRLLPILFDERHARDRKDVVLLHLDHPLIRRALAVFRQNLWSAGLHESHRMSRASYRVLSRRDLPAPMVVLVSRLVAVGEQGNRLHEELLHTGGPFREDRVEPAPSEALAARLEQPGTHPPLPASLADRLRALFPGHERDLRKALEAQIAAARKDLGRRLQERATTEAKEIRGLIDERQREIAKRVAAMEKQLGATQLALFDDLEREQWQRDLSWLRGRKDQLETERATEPDAVKARYRLRDAVRAFPLALVYLLPEDLVEATSAESTRGGRR
jgi:hypothetical protein